MKKEEIISRFQIDNSQLLKTNSYLEMLKEYNSHTNLVGKSTLENPWKAHILDSLQLLKFITNKKLSILDMGSGAGLPGIPLSIMGFYNVTLVDSNGKKIKFLKKVKESLGLKNTIVQGRIESLSHLSFDIITSRALSNLNSLLTYSQKLVKKNTLLVFLKGKAVNDEILFAQKNWIIDYKKFQSISDDRGAILIIKKFKKK